MKTEVIMKRELFGRDIRQKSKSEFFSATDLVNAGNRWRVTNGKGMFNLSTFLKAEKTKEFIDLLEQDYGQVISKGRGRSSTTWVHPFLFIDIALAINPELKLEVYKWLYDELLKYRNASGDSYKKMCGAIACKTAGRDITTKIQEVARKIKEEVGVNNWEEATEAQLKKRNLIQDKISTLSDIVPIDKALHISLEQVRRGN